MKHFNNFKLSNICKIVMLIIASVAFVVLLKINTNTHMYHDEFVYSVIYNTKEKVDSLADVFVSTKNIYLLHNGRAITHFLIVLFLMTPKIFRNIIISLLFVILLMELIFFSRKKEYTVKDILIKLLVFPLLWYTIPVFGETIIWFSGCINYLLIYIFLLLYIYQIDTIWKKEENVTTKKQIAMIIFSFFVSSLHETGGIIAISYIAFCFIYLLIKNKKINKNLLVFGIAGFIGFLTIILSPGSNVRKSAELQRMDVIPSLAERLKNILNMLQNTISFRPIIFCFLLGFIIYFVIQLIKNKKETLKNKEMFSNLFLITSATITYFAMIVSPVFYERVTFCAYVIYVYVFLKILYCDIENKKVELFKKILILIFIICLGKTAYKDILQTFELTNLHSIAWQEREREIEEQKSSGKKDIYLKPLNCNFNRFMYVGDISTSVTYNHNGSMAAYYNVDSMRLLSPYYLDFEIGNCNKDNTSNITLKTNSYEEKQKFYLLDEEIYNKQAPYKRYKNSYETGKIKLYFAMPNLEDLAIHFEKEQKLTLKSIKLYNSENILFDLCGENILNKVKLENIDIEKKDENEIVLNIHENGKINIIEGENKI